MELMLQYIVVILIGIAVVAFVVKGIYKTCFKKNGSVNPCDNCSGCTLKNYRQNTYKNILKNK
jgi:hypothetical protein